MYCVDPATGEQGPAEEVADEFLKEMEICYANRTGQRLPCEVGVTRKGRQSRTPLDHTTLSSNSHIAFSIGLGFEGDYEQFVTSCSSEIAQLFEGICSKRRAEVGEKRSAETLDSP
jgi:hypothetical protein